MHWHVISSAGCERNYLKTGIMLFILTLILVAVMGAIIWDRHHGFYRDVRFWISLVCLGFLIGFGATHYW